MSEVQQHSSLSPSFSLARVLMLVVPLAAAIFIANRIYKSSVQENAQADLEKMTVTRLLGKHDGQTSLASTFVDKDGDMVADSPEDEAKLIDPEEINFSYIATSSSGDEAATWKELVEALSAKLGKKVNFVSYADVEEQKRAIKHGELHIAAFATGDVQSAVNGAGFVPVACQANKDGKYIYTMKIIVPADSPIKKIDDIRGRRMTFVRPGSNSGCTAALVTLMEKHQLQPERDYSWGFSYGHEKSIDDIAAKKYQAAAVASDILDRRIGAGIISADAVRTIYESEPFPTGVLGYVYNLKPALRDGIRETIFSFDWTGSGLAKANEATGFVKFAPISYKDDWASVRKLTDSGGEILASLASAGG